MCEGGQEEELSRFGVKRRDASLWGVHSTVVVRRGAVGTLREENYLRLRAEAHEKAGDDRQAFDTYLRLIDLPNPSNEPMRTSAGLSIGRERRVKAKVQAIYARADDARRKSIDEGVDSVLIECPINPAVALSDLSVDVVVPEDDLQGAATSE